MMNKLETRGILAVRDGDQVCTQEAIPWCITHDTKGDNDHLMFHRGAKICVISTGPPDHKWWRDTE